MHSALSSSGGESENEVGAKEATPLPASVHSVDKHQRGSEDKTGFTVVSRKWRGFVNGKLQVFPETPNEDIIIQNCISVKKLKLHIFEIEHFLMLKIQCLGNVTSARTFIVIVASVNSLRNALNVPVVTRDCKKTLQTPAKCALCGGLHPANFSGCSKNPIDAKPV
ncbi:hypothetical protein NPIL_664871 [Nephila pilipes]|uniref:Uncharacterized protein n=1 Tax=Nephila pilipes TaxID=299642 RepID=A0A8X6QJK5_NEPPI|nr:hypothetical protein NPIL_664871 [Nephila pilipes]